MIGSVGSTAQTAYTTTARQGTQQQNTPTEAAGSDKASEVNLSPGGKLISDLPPLILDPKVHMANAEKRLSELMQQMGIPGDTKIDIHLSNSGHFTVKGDNDKLAELEKMLNDGSEMKLRNSLIGAHTGSVIQHIAAATQKTQARVDANPGATETLWNQLLAEANRISGQSADFTWSGNALNGVFADGTAMAIA